MLPALNDRRMRVATKYLDDEESRMAPHAPGPAPAWRSDYPPPPPSSQHHQHHHHHRHTQSSATPPLPPLRATFYFNDERPGGWHEDEESRRSWPAHESPPNMSQQPEYYTQRDRVAPMDRLALPPRHPHPLHPYEYQKHEDRYDDMDGEDDEEEEEDDRAFKKSMTSRETGAAAKKRSRRMSNSERGKLYRSRRKEYVDSLEQQVESLKRQVEELKMHGKSPPQDSMVIARDRGNASYARTVCEYFSLFQFGVPIIKMGKNVSNSAIARSSQQVSFLQAQADPGMSFGSHTHGHDGIQMWLDQWERYTMYHSSIQFDLNSLEVVKEDEMPMVTATATLKVCFSRVTIEKVFPHILWNEALVQKLIGREVEYNNINKFYFDKEGKIARYDTEVDFVGAFIKALGSPREAMMVVGSALIKGQHMIGPGEEQTSSPHEPGARYGAEGFPSSTGSYPRDPPSSYYESDQRAGRSSEQQHTTTYAREQYDPRMRREEARRADDGVHWL
ncbi:hypothetical protein Poli38472_014287 [Pythium oligandrum]|uniref:BZIP domain-containing protein n=1 Tax=Pythium oligandrum TaxID=41045 RepID=A0A8K1FHR3_PYTOL|nr:hypothetical protein Poli38472_014287 [Pythium oligandrum]|eukprot:TMW64170.1 hypothetical protein Poli38472_014287 [Pythium oligandrum]